MKGMQTTRTSRDLMKLTIVAKVLKSKQTQSNHSEVFITLTYGRPGTRAMDAKTPVSLDNFFCL